MADFQSTFILLAIVLLAYLIVDGWWAQAVWVKGARDGLFSFRNWAHKRSRDEDPWPYWFAMGFYSLALISLGVLLLLT
jgi:hypothetical protein